ncbi:WD40-repeat-containing domain protein [Chytriomyces sp. MP71]|nr:WD40-repeat-containing domain protein [Chytriomyces sp. MP71]
MGGKRDAYRQTQPANLASRMEGLVEAPLSVSPSTHTHRSFRLSVAESGLGEFSTSQNGPSGAGTTGSTGTRALNKVFTSQWLDCERVVVGTKCSSLVVLCTTTRRVTPIAPILGFWDPSRLSYVHGSVIASSPVSPTSRIPACTGIHGSAINASRSLLAISAGHPMEFIQVFSLPQLEPYALLRAHSDMVFGIEFIGDSCLVSGGRDGRICFWDLQQECEEVLESVASPLFGIKVFKPVSVSYGATISANSSPNRSAVGSTRFPRSGGIGGMVGSYPTSSPPRNLSPTSSSTTSCHSISESYAASSVLPSAITTIVTQPAKNLFAKVFSSMNTSSTSPRSPPRRFHYRRTYNGTLTLDTKVRDLKVTHAGQGVAALTTDGTVKLYDAAVGKGIDAASLTGLSLTHKAESVCLALRGDVLAVGGMSHVSFVDVRCLGTKGWTASLDAGWGVRSLAFDARGVLAVGGGMGRVSFYDERMRRYLDWDVDEEEEEGGLGSGSVAVKKRMRSKLDGQYAGYLDAWECDSQMAAAVGSFGGGGDRMWRDAIYTLSYCPFGVRLFAGGGPLQLNLSGSYAGVWE